MFEISSNCEEPNIPTLNFFGVVKSRKSTTQKDSHSCFSQKMLRSL